jgi:hypothetical protein
VATAGRHDGLIVLFHFAPFVASESSRKNGESGVSNWKQQLDATAQQMNYKPVKVSATVLEFDKPNLNRRIYPSSLKPSLLKQFQDYANRGFLGMLDNPSTAQVLFSQVSHVVIRLWADDAKLICEIETVDTPCGRVLRNLLQDHPEEVAFRPMGVGGGRVNEDGILVIDDGYKLISINAVPAHEAS